MKARSLHITNACVHSTPLANEFLSTDFGRQDSPEGFGPETLGNSFATTLALRPPFVPCKQHHRSSWRAMADMFAAQGRAYDTSRYQTSPCLRAEPLEHHKNDGYAHGGNLHADNAQLYHLCDSSVQQRRICDIVHRGLQQDLCHILACLAEALTTTGQRSGQHVPSHTR